MNFRIAFSIVPVVIFWLLLRVAEPWVAILGSFAASAVVFYYNRQHRVIGMLGIFGFIVVAASAVVGMISNNEHAYLAAGPVSDFLIVPFYAASIWMGKPLIGGISRELVPVIAGRVPADARLFVLLTIVWAFYEVAHGVLRLMLLFYWDLSAGEYIIWSRLLTWPFSGTMIAITAALIYREARHHPRLPRLEPEPGLAPA